METEDKLNVFYLEIEEGVREAVYKLRNAGINTQCSCHHEGYIQCQSMDPTTEQRRIFDVMYELGIEDFTASLLVEHSAIFWHSFWEIKSPKFKVHNDP